MIISSWKLLACPSFQLFRNLSISTTLISVEEEFFLSIFARDHLDDLFCKLNWAIGVFFSPMLLSSLSFPALFFLLGFFFLSIHAFDWLFSLPTNDNSELFKLLLLSSTELMLDWAI